MANLNLTDFEQAVDRLKAPLKNITAATERFRDRLGAAERATSILTERQRDARGRFVKSTEAIKEQTGRLGRQGDAVRNVVSKSGRSFRLSGEVLGWLGSLAYTVKSEFVDSAASFERFRTALEMVEGSSGKARASMKWIDDFAVKTPFELDQVTDAFVKLRSVGMDPTQGLLRTLGDASAATGKPLMRAVEAMTGAVRGDHEGLAEFGIEARAAEGGKVRYEYEVDGETKIAEAMAADGAQIRRVLGGILDIKFGGAMAKESKTFMGMLGNLADQWARFRNLVMASGLFDFLKGRLGALLDTLDRMAASGELQQWAKRVGDGLITAFQQAAVIGKQLWPVVTGIAGAVGKAANAVGGFGNLFQILVGLGAAKKLWPMTEGIRGLGSKALQAAGGPRQLSKRLAAFTLAAGKAAGGAIKSFGASLASFAATGATAAIAGLKGLIVSTWTWTAALLANPITWVVAAVAGAAALIYKYWEPVSGFFIRLWDSVRVSAAAAWEWIKGVWNAAAEWFGSLNLAEMGKALLATLGEGIRAGADTVLTALKQALGPLSRFWPSSDAEEGPLSKLTASGASILDTMGAGVLRAGPDALRRPLAQTLGAAAAGAALSLPPAAPAAPVAPVNQGVHIRNLIINQQPGEDAGALADKVIREIEHRRRIRAREALFDEL